MLKHIQRFCQKQILLIIILFILFCCIVIPVCLNWLLFFNIKTHNSNDGDWLGFWGSFLGGIIGGFATLIGVILTIKKSDMDRQREDEKIKEERKPRLIPIKKSFNIIREFEKVYIFNKLDVLRKEYIISDILELKVVNASKESAIDISMEWIQCDNEFIKKYSSFNEEEISIYNDILDKYKLTKSAIKEEEFIRGLDEILISVHANLNIFIEQVIKEFIHNYKEVNSGKIYFKYDIPLGILIFKSKNVYGENVNKNNKYLVSLSIIDVCTTKIEEYMGTLDFKLIKENV